MLGALKIILTPGPLLIKHSPDMLCGVIASIYNGNLMLLILNLPLNCLWVRVLRILMFTFLINHSPLFDRRLSLNNSTTNIYVAIVFSVDGLLMKKFAFEPTPLVLASVLGPLLKPL